MIKRLALIEPAAPSHSYPIFRSRWSTLAIGSVLFLGAALRFSTALSNPLQPHLTHILFGIASIGLVFLVARDAFGFPAGVLSALFYALSAIAAIQSFSVPSNAPAVFFGLLSMFFGLAAWNRGRGFLSMLAGTSIGLAAALDWHAATLGVFPLLTHLTVDRTRKKRHSMIFAGTALLAYCLTEGPNAVGLASWPQIRSMMLHPAIHWHNLASNIPLAAGWPLAAAGFTGWIWIGYRLFTKRDFPRARVEEPYIYALLWFYGCAIVFSALLFMRSDNAADAHAAMPVVAILAGCLLSAYGTHPNNALRKLGMAACAIVSLYSFAYASAHVNLYRIETPSQTASDWIEHNIAKGELIGIARNDAWTPECLTGHHPNYEVLEGGSSDTPLEECLLKLDRIKNEARYLVVNEIEYRASEESGLTASTFQNDFTEIAQFDRRASFLGIKFSKKAGAPSDWLAPNAAVRIFARKKPGFPS